jgi:hypothetical protein
MLGFVLNAPGGAATAAQPVSDSSTMSPADLAQLDRALTPAEQKRVDVWQAGQADATLAQVRKDSPVKSADVTYDPKTNAFTVAAKLKDDGGGTPWWQYAIGVVGAVAIVAGVGAAVKR